MNITWVVKLGFTLLFISQLLSCTSVKNPSDVPEYSGRLFIDIQSDPRFYFQSPFQLQGTREEGILSIETALGMRILNIIWRKNYVAIERNGQLYPYHSWESMIQEQTQLGELPIDGLFTWLENG
ncbi:MAG: hypothetical protein QM520_04105, partial [Gammaproteobacteria bacterium]|nr:hypothetical protein [Gammaproteobacteria bacterium]